MAQHGSLTSCSSVNEVSNSGTVSCRLRCSTGNASDITQTLPRRARTAARRSVIGQYLWVTAEAPRQPEIQTPLTAAQVARSLIGLDELAARAVVDNNGCVWRLAARDGTAFPCTRDLRPSRINVAIGNGTVESASVG
jgi:hypothetical protein